MRDAMQGGLAQSYREYGKRGRRRSAPALPCPEGLRPNSPLDCVACLAHIRDMGCVKRLATDDFGRNAARAVTVNRP